MSEDISPASNLIEATSHLLEVSRKNGASNYQVLTDIISIDPEGPARRLLTIIAAMEIGL